MDHLGQRVAEQLASVPGAEQIRQSLLNDTLEYHQGFVAQASDDPELRSQLALTHSRIGSLIQELKSSREAIEHYQRSAQLYGQIADEGDASPAIRQQMAQNWNHLGLAIAAAGEFSEAKASYENAIETQNSLVAQQPDNIAYATELALTTNNLGLLFREAGQSQPARQWFERAIAQLSAIVSGDGENLLAVRGLAASLSNLSSCHWNRNLPSRSICSSGRLIISLLPPPIRPIGFVPRPRYRQRTTILVLPV